MIGLMQSAPQSQRRTTAYIVEKLEELCAETKKLAALAEEVTRKPVLTAWDRKHFEEYLELIAEIDDYAARLQRPGEKWKEKRYGVPR